MENSIGTTQFVRTFESNVFEQMKHIVEMAGLPADKSLTIPHNAKDEEVLHMILEGRADFLIMPAKSTNYMENGRRVLTNNTEVLKKLHANHPEHTAKVAMPRKKNQKGSSMFYEGGLLKRVVFVDADALTPNNHEFIARQLRQHYLSGQMNVSTESRQKLRVVGG